MSRIFEALTRAEAAAKSERRRSRRKSAAVGLRIFGYETGGKPFYQEGSTIDVSAEGALLVSSVPACEGEQLVLINGATGKLQECRIVRAHCRNTQALEIAVSFVNPDPDFWQSLPDSPAQPAENRRHQRITLPRGMVVIWQGPGGRVVSRVETLSRGGLSMATFNPPEAGDLVNLYVELPDGGLCARGVVRHSRKGIGMGVEFTAMRGEGRARLDQLLGRLLSDPKKL